MGTQIDTIRAWRLRIPLIRPYHLSFRQLTFFDMVLVELHDSARQMVSYGESCPLPGYGTETAEEVWAHTKKYCDLIYGCDVAVAREVVETSDGGSFSKVAVQTALEFLTFGATPGDPLHVPLVGTILAHDIKDIPHEVTNLLEQGYTTLKFKVGFDPVQDAQSVKQILSLLDATSNVRLDANQGFSPPDARLFMDRIGPNPNGIELLEQPFPKDRWDWTRELVPYAPFPIMLDESIEQASDVYRARDVGAQYVKFKLVKAGSLAALDHLIALASSLNLEIIVGNGVAGVVDNRYEALAHVRGHLITAGEMNGFKKISTQLFSNEPVKNTSSFMANTDDLGQLLISANPQMVQATFQPGLL